MSTYTWDGSIDQHVPQCTQQRKHIVPTNQQQYVKSDSILERSKSQEGMRLNERRSQEARCTFTETDIWSRLGH